MGTPIGFDFVARKNGTVLITHGDREAATLRGDAARRFLADIKGEDPQEVMARVTGNYRRGNERSAKNHPRNRSR